MSYLGPLQHQGSNELIQYCKLPIIIYMFLIKSIFSSIFSWTINKSYIPKYNHQILEIKKTTTKTQLKRELLRMLWSLFIELAFFIKLAFQDFLIGTQKYSIFIVSFLLSIFWFLLLIFMFEWLTFFELQRTKPKQIKLL